MENIKKIGTLCFIIENSRVLLGMKKRGFGQGWWNGFGGKLLPGESIVDAMKRETKEECGVDVTSIKEAGLLNFTFVDGSQLECHVYTAQEYDGEPQETEEMRPQWFYFNEIPFDKMFPDDRFWFPYLLEGKKFQGDFEFDGKFNVVSNNVVEI